MVDMLTEEELAADLANRDFLNRQYFIAQVKNVIDLLAAGKKNSCFAISGSWGIGKSYVLDKLEQQLQIEQSEDPASDKYFVFHFNCWEYDFYAEPLVAIVASMMDEIHDKDELYPESVQAHVISAAKFVLSKLYEGGSNYLENKIGVNPKKLTDGLAEIHASAEDALEGSHDYDEYFAFKQALLYLRERLQKIASERTVVFVVDELDRCLPEYQIKVLERLHHVFNGINNMQVILAVDKTQLERTIQKMFGDHVDTQKYLAKFIKFEIELDEGKYSHQFEDALGYYFNQFDGNDDPDIIEFMKNIFSGIAIRERIEIVEKCHLLHSLLPLSDVKSDATILCIELFLAIVVHTKADLPSGNNVIRFDNMFGKNATDGLLFLQKKMGRTIRYTSGEERMYYNFAGKSHVIDPRDLWGILLGCYAIIVEATIGGYMRNSFIMDVADKHTRWFWQLLQTIK